MNRNDDQAVRYRCEDGIAWVVFDRPGRANAANPALMDALCAQLDRAAADAQARAIVLTHTGRHFMAGADLDFLDSLCEAPAETVRDRIYQSFQGAAKRLYLMQKPTLCAMAGGAITVGCELALACDFRLVTPRAYFQESWIKLGLIPPLGGLKKLPALVGYGLATEMVLRARRVHGEEAVRHGLASQLCEDEAGLHAEAARLGAELAALPPQACAAAKEGLRRGLECSFDEGWSHSLLAQSLLVGSPDFVAGLRAVQAGTA